jgi:NAD(P)-dependent dehydrogenase (short-subunit alcohol dehydrogenase family)
MPNELTGQVAIVTGGGRGIGRAIAQAFAAAGAAVTVTARSEDQLAQTVALIESAGWRALAVTADVTDQRAVEQVVKATEARFGPVDVLVNNAAVIEPIGPVWEVDPAEWRRCLDVNVYGTFLFARAVLPGMIARHRGRIINMSGGGAVEPEAYFTGYGTSKAAILRFTDTLAAETREHGISVFAMAPGGVQTTMSDEVSNSSWAQQRYPVLAADPGSFFSTPIDEPGRLCAFLASGQVDALSGRYFHVRDDLIAKMQRTDEIQQNDLYTLRLRT